MKKIIAFLMIFTLLFAFCACGETTVEPTDATADGETVTPADVSDTHSNSDGDSVTQAAAVNTTANADASENIPVLEDYTLVAEQTKMKDNFVFTGEKEATLTCNHIVMVESDGTTEMALTFAEDGSGLTMYSLQSDGEIYTTQVEFDEEGRLTAVYNGSGSYSIYEYTADTCRLQTFDAEDALQDERTYYYDANGNTERVERGDADGIYEKYFYTYNEAGQAVQLRVENQSGYALYAHTYTENNLIQTTRIEQNGEFYILQEYTYDEHGNRATLNTYQNEDRTPNVLDVNVLYANEYSADGVYLGTVEKGVLNNKIYISVSYGYETTQYPHYAEFVDTYFMTY